MSLTLYRKYRPQTFSDFIGQNHIKITLQNELETDKVAHAYLFAGPHGTGKTTTARLLAKAINCLNRRPDASEPCNTCASCKEIMENHSIDIIEIDAASHTGVDNVRENIISNSRFVPTTRKFKVFIIDEVHMLSISAFNALLKTLEEPPAHAIFILATTEIHKLPTTIISRCQRFDFKKVNIDDIIQRLNFIIGKEGKQVENEVLEAIAQHADGSIRDAESLLGQVLTISGDRITMEEAQLVVPRSDFKSVLEFLELLQRKQASQAIDFINRLTNDGADLQVFAMDSIEVLRKIILVKTSGQLNEYSMDLSRDQEAWVAKLAQKLKMDELILMINNFINIKQNLKHAEIIQLPFELAIVRICEDRPNEPVIPPVEKNETKSAKTKKSVSAKPEPPKDDANTKMDIGGSLDIDKPEPETKAPVALSMEFLKEKWELILNKIKQYNYTIFSFMRVNHLLGIKGDLIQIGVCYKFHFERLSERKNKDIIEKVFEEILGQRVRIECKIVENHNEEPSYVKEDKAMQGLLEDFGGKMIG